MKDVRYYKEGSHNYMVLSCSAGEKKSYQQKMMERQNLPHIFSCRIKYINGTAFYYYDITSKVNMQNLFHGRPWDLTMIKKVLLDYETALAELDSFLLEQDKLVLDPEYIYYDYGADHYIFLFYPENQSEGNIYETLFDFWVEHLDNQDTATVECIYKLYEEAENCCLGIERVKEVLGQYDVHSAEEEQAHLDTAETAWDGGMVRENSMQDQTVPAGQSIYEPASETEDGQDVLRRGPGLAFYAVFLVLVMMGEAGVGAVYLLFQCTEQEKMVLLAAAAVMACLFVCVGRLLVKERKFQKRKESYDHALTEFRENDFERAAQPVPEKVQMKEFLSVGRNAAGVQGVQGQKHAEQDDRAGETVFFSPENECENKLYALDRKNKQHISLESLPITIGKLKGAVDVYINDTSVSRMHAQIETDGTVYYIKDLNSTNGTFLNGLRLNPNDRRELEPGDEIRFGKLRYSFR